MAQRFYQPVGDDLKLWADPKDFVKSDLEEEVLELEFLMSQGDVVREKLGNCAGFATLEAYDAYLYSEWSRKKDIIDFFDYSDTALNLTVKDGMWMTPDSVEDVCGERVGNEALYSIDGDTGTFWQDDTNEAHQITFNLRGYAKKVAKVRIYRGTNARSALDNLTIQIANSIPGLDIPANEAITGASISTDDAWNEIEFTTKQIGKIMRLTGFGSLNALNETRIREIEFWVETVEYD